MAKRSRTDILNTAPIYASHRELTYTGSAGDYKEVRHSAKMALENSTISLGFSLDRLVGNYALVSKDGQGTTPGDFTVWVKDGTLSVELATPTGTQYLNVPSLILSTNTTYQFAVSFGEAGLSVWVNGELVAAEPEATQSIATNTRPLIIGASHAWNGVADPAHSLFKGVISEVQVYGSQIGKQDMLTLADAVEPGLADAARAQLAMEDLAPVFQQLPNGSDTLVKILGEYGVDTTGAVSGGLNMMTRGRGDHVVTGTDAADGINAGFGDDEVMAGSGNDVVQGSYGNDKLWGGNGNDILDGGHGEDRLWGGNGNDLLISRADAREPSIFFDPNRDEADPLGELTDGKLYPNQPIPGDDVLTGGRGADIFYFQTLINTKARYVLKHTNTDGTINWAGVAGENDKLHDHWVDTMGNDVVTDFSRAEGDRIVIEGHTVQIASIKYGDANRDGVMDHSVISLYSDQGAGGGAHNDDRLGTITVYGDLVKLSDITHTSRPTYGIIKDIDDLKEALKPLSVGTDTGRIKPPKDLPSVDDLGLPVNLKPVLAVAGANAFTPDDRAPLVFDHSKKIDLTAGTIAISFSTTELGGNQTLFSKDASGYGTGGHITAYVNPLGHLIVRLQDNISSQYLEVKHAIKAGGNYDVALSFGSGGVELYLNGARVAYDKDITVDWDSNTEALIVGAAGWSNTPGATDHINSHFNGTITDFMVFDGQLTADAIYGTDARADYSYFDKSIEKYAISQEKGGAVVIGNGSLSTTLMADTDFVKFKDMIVRVDDFQFGSKAADEMHGLDGSDVLIGKAGDDYLAGHDNDDLLRGGAGNDTLSGGDGKDQLIGGDGNDRLYGGNGIDILKGGTGDDDLYGDTGNDRLYGGLGDDDLFGHAWNDGGNASNDRAYFDGNLADFTFETKTWCDSRRGETVTQLIVTDSADGGLDGFYEGKDRLMDIDQLVFADQSVAFDDLL